MCVDLLLVDRVVDELNPERNMAKYDIEGWQDPVVSAW